MIIRHMMVPALAVALASATPAGGQRPHEGHPAEHTTAANPAREDSATAAREPAHSMWARDLGAGWRASGMAQVFPMLTSGSPLERDRPVHDTEVYATQPALMLSLESPGARAVLRTTLNFEGWTQRDGEYTFGGWGEGYIDKRHPHTLLHELMLSANLWEAPGGSLSVSAGKGFAPYGTEDPMSRPAVKFPTNHHLSQVLERWTVNGAYLHRSGLSLEAGLFGGGEPEDPYDLGNIESFGDSWSARVAQRLGGTGVAAPWEVSASFARVAEVHHQAREVTRLYNAAVRHAGSHAFGRAYALAEASRSEPERGSGYWSLLGEGRVEIGRHRPYYRGEYSIRPEYARQGAAGSPGFYRYDHDSHATGASRWQIHTLGYETQAARRGVLARPFVELQYHRVAGERGAFSPSAAFGDDRFWAVSTGFKVFLGGDAMRMGSYGVLDPMTAAARSGPGGHGGH